jgi:hypothetical protein
LFARKFFFVTPRGVYSFALGDASLPLPLIVAPTLLFCRPERSEGSLGACAPRDDIPDAVPNEVRDAI